MPHATENGNMSSQTMTNGSQPSSKFISHVTSYPVVSDSIEAVKQNPYGKKSLELANDTYQKYGKAVEPYLETPYSYAKPYVTKADELADSGLGHVESHFPIVKEDTDTVVDTAKSYVFWPLKVVDDGRNYVFKTWNDEYDKTARHKNRGPGLSTSIMALVSTELKIASDFFQAVADFLGPKYEESKKKSADYVQAAQDKAHDYSRLGQQKVDEYSKFGQDKAQEYQKFGEQKADEYSKVGQQKTDEYAKYGQEKKDQAKDQAGKTKEEAKAKAGQK